MFKNATVYRIAPTWSADAAVLREALEKNRYAECGASQQQAIGWVEPRGAAHAPLLEAVAGQWLCRLMIESKVLPGGVVKRKTDERVKLIEAQTGRKPGRKQAKEIKEEIVQELLPRAFTKLASVGVWIAPEQRLLVVDTGSQARADEVVSLLVKSVDGLAVALLQTTQSAGAAMSQWLATGEAPPGFSIDRECELKSGDEMKSVVRYARHGLDTDDVRQHITGGKVPTRLAMTWEGRVSFMLTDAMQLRRLAFLDGVFEGGKAGGEDRFDSDAAIATGEVGRLLPDLIDALGGESLPLGG